METQRFAVTTTVFIDAADADEAALILERALAGRFDNELVCVSPFSSQKWSLPDEGVDFE